MVLRGCITLLGLSRDLIPAIKATFLIPSAALIFAETVWHGIPLELDRHNPGSSGALGRYKRRREICQIN
jgi:hypothetical protein